MCPIKGKKAVMGGKGDQTIQKEKSALPVLVLLFVLLLVVIVEV